MKFLLILGLFVLPTQFIFAEDDHVIEVEVIASPITEGNVLSKYAGLKTVVSEAQVEDLNAQDIASALRSSPGLNISRYNHIGSFGGGAGGALYIRGLGSSRPGAEIQTLIEGVPVYNAAWSHPLLDIVPVDMAEAIEVYKGPQPALFGNAFGAINLSGKRVVGEKALAKTSLALGSYESFIEKLEIGNRQGAFDYYFSQAFKTSAGHREDANGELQNYYLSLGHDLGTKWTSRLVSLASYNGAKDPGRVNEIDSKNGKYKTSFFTNILSFENTYDKAQGAIKLYATSGSADWLDQKGLDNQTLNDTLLFGIRGHESISFSAATFLLIGVDLDFSKADVNFLKDSSDSSRFHSPTFHLFSPYTALNYQINLDHDISINPSFGLRVYEHSDFDESLAPHAGVVLTYKDTELYGSYARGVSYPGLNTVVFSENIIPALGPSWKNLEAEVLDHFEFGLKHSFSERLKSSISLFYDKGRDRYVILTPPPPPPSFQSIDKFTVKGFEASVTYALLPRVLSAFGGISYLDLNPRDLPYAPRWSISGGLNFHFTDRLKLSMDAEFLDSMHVSPQLRSAGSQNLNEVDAYFLLNSQLTYVPVSAGKSIGEYYLAVENLTDTEYEYQVGYPMPGINAMVGFRYYL